MHARKWPCDTRRGYRVADRVRDAFPSDLVRIRRACGTTASNRTRGIDHEHTCATAATIDAKEKTRVVHAPSISSPAASINHAHS
jgi:hypothetical protein